MEFGLSGTFNRSRAFRVCVEEVRVCFLPFVPPKVRGGLLRGIRYMTRYSSVLVVAVFALHCTGPHTRPQPPVPVAPLPEAEEDSTGYQELGEASWYGGGADRFAGKPTASGETMDPALPTCAHRTLPFGTYLQVENLDNGRKAVTRVNDRGPFVHERVLDCSRRTAKDLGMLDVGVARVRLRVVDKDGHPVALDPTLDAQDPYTIQVTALADAANIERLARELRAEFGPVTFQEAVLRDGRTVKRVRAGSFTNLADAEKMADRITRHFKGQGVEPFITRQR